MKYVSVDCETTGLDPKTCDILEFGAIIDDLNDLKPIEELPRFHCYFLPPPENNGMYHGQPYALSMHPTIFRRIAEREKPYTYVSPNKFGYMFNDFLNKNGIVAENTKERTVINVGGKNPSFDIGFLEDKTDVGKFVGFRHRVIDPSILFLKSTDEKILSMGDLKKRLGLPEFVAHNAMEDAQDVVRIIRKAIEIGRFFY